MKSTATKESLQIYAQVLKLAWADAKMGQEEAEVLALLRKSFGLTQQDHDALQQEVQLEIYLQAIVDGWKNGVITPQDSEKLDQLREQFNIPAEEHLRLEKQVRKEILKQKS